MFDDMNTKPITHASVFSGIGGPEVAAAMLGWENLFHCEINPFGKAVLDFWFPNAESYEDITKTDFISWRGRVNVLTGGFPCQPFSYAGQRRGADDDRYLWPFMFRCIDQIQPDWVVCENVGGILTMVEQGSVSKVASEADLFGEADTVHRYEYRATFTLERICQDLRSHGYEVQPILIPACSVGAPHRRDRVFIVARRLASDANGSADRGSAGADESKGREERLQERDQVREPNQPNQVRPEGEVYVASDTNRGRSREVPSSVHSWESDGNVSERNGGQRNASDSFCEGLEGQDQSGSGEAGERMHLRGDSAGCDRSDGERAGGGKWEYNSRGGWMPSVSPIHRGGDGIPFPLDNLTISQSKWRNESIKAFGNAIVPQVMYEIFRAIEIVENPL